jgi:hypothetical protein
MWFSGKKMIYQHLLYGHLHVMQDYTLGLLDLIGFEPSTTQGVANVNLINELFA